MTSAVTQMEADRRSQPARHSSNASRHRPLVDRGPTRHPDAEETVGLTRSGTAPNEHAAWAEAHSKAMAHHTTVAMTGDSTAVATTTGHRRHRSTVAMA